MNRAVVAACGLAFILLATMNAAGYRYGASDQAFYVPAIVRHLDPALFPRDAALIDAQARLTLVDDDLAAIVRATGVDLPTLLLVLYLATLALLYSAALAIGSSLYRTRWAPFACAAALTLRHAIAKTGANSLEGYFHPRQLAFALGLLAVANFLRAREAVAAVLLALAFTLHPTTAAWFVVWLTVALWFARPSWRPAVAGAAALATAGVALAIWRGPLAGHLIRMDPDWLAVIHEKDYLFPLEWPVDAWITNLLALPVVVWCWRSRARARLTVPRETPLVAGVLSLLVLFVIWLPFNAFHLALAVQLQLSRVFWMLDTVGVLYLVWAIAEGVGPAPARRAAVACAAIAAVSIARGGYSALVEFHDRPLFRVNIPPGDWRDATDWARTTSRDTEWLLDPAHAARYGQSFRVAAERDVLFEALKDPAIAMYDRDIAMRVADRERALAALPWDTPDGARALSRRYGLDYLLIDRPIALPLAHQAGSIYIYRLR